MKFCKKCTSLMSDDCEKCPQCGSSDLIFSSDNEETDDTPLTEATTQEKTPPIKAKVLLMFALIVVGLIIWDFVDPPLWWQEEAQSNKKVILAYAAEHFPNAKIVKQVYRSSQPNLSANPFDFIEFEQDGIEFSIWANDGIFLGENYLSAKGSQYIKREILLPFFDERHLDITTCYVSASGVFDGDISKFEGLANIIIIPQYEDGKNTPMDVAWLYDFYIYIKENSNLKKYRISIEYRIHNNVKTKYEIYFSDDSYFETREDFYAAFQYIESNL